MSKLEFYVLRLDNQTNKVAMWNIFNSHVVKTDTIAAVNKYLINPPEYKYNNWYGYEAIKYQIDDILFYQFWCRSEYEIQVGSLVAPDFGEFSKVDCYYQTHANIDTITKLIIEYITDSQ